MNYPIITTLPEVGGNGGSGETGPASADSAAKTTKLAIKTVVRILARKVDIEKYLLGFKNKLLW